MMKYENPNIQILNAEEDDFITKSVVLPEMPLNEF